MNQMFKFAISRVHCAWEKRETIEVEGNNAEATIVRGIHQFGVSTEYRYVLQFESPDQVELGRWSPEGNASAPSERFAIRVVTPAGCTVEKALAAQAFHCIFGIPATRKLPKPGQWLQERGPESRASA